MKRFAELTDHQFTQSFHQPDDYHYCQDSVIFAQFLATEVRRLWADARALRALDVCAGCGIIGIELGHHVPELTQIDFVELQEEFRPSFEANVAQAELASPLPRRYRFLNENFSRLAEPDRAETYDLIFANPPYFFSNEGVQSPSLLRNRCRFFLDGSLSELVSGALNALKPDGVAYLLVKSGARHGRNTPEDLRRSFESTSVIETCADIRGTYVVSIRRRS